MRRPAIVGIMLMLPIALSGQQAPVAPVKPRYQILHDETRVDNYFWLREKSNPEVIKYLEAENAYTSARMKHTEALQETLYKELLGRIKETDSAVPYRKDGYWYYTRTEQGKGYPIYCRKKGSLTASEEVMLDQNALAQGKKFHAFGGMDVSPDGTLLLYLEDLTAFREYTLYVKNLVTGQIVDKVEHVWNGTAWANDNKTFFYMRADTAKRGNAVWRHVIGSPASKDVKIFQEDDVLNNVGIARSRSGKYVFIQNDSFTSSEWRFVPTAAPTAEPKTVAARRPRVEYSVDHAGGHFYIYTNDDAKNFRVVRAPESDPFSATWQDWLPHRSDVFIEGIDLFSTFAVVVERRGGLRRLRVIDLKTKASHDIEMPEAAYAVSPSTNEEFSTSWYRFNYSSLVTPASVYDYHVGTQVDGSNPLLLYAYGSYGATTEPGFNRNVFSLVDRGFVYAIAHIRGGQEMGRQWYDDGKMLRKMNTFHDFIDVAQYLVKSGYTRPDKLIANGGSAGGLLMGAVANMRPDLFKAIVAEVPFVDVINTMFDETLPLTAQEWEQWGNPRDPEHYDYMRRYSPYDNVEKKAYPWLLVTTSLNDSQVMYWEPAKWVAKLRAMKTDTNPLIFKVNLAGGHGGSSGRYDQLKEVAFKYAFMIDAVK